jgi:hypothetical protein
MIIATSQVRGTGDREPALLRVVAAGQVDEAAAAVNEGADRGLATCPDDEVAFPLADTASPEHDRRAGVDQLAWADAPHSAGGRDCPGFG